MIAGDIMNTPVVSITEGQTLQETIALMAKNKISGLPVVDTEHRLVGIISNSDVVRYSQQINVVPLLDLSGWVSPHTDVYNIASISKGIDLLANTKVGYLMKRKVRSATQNADIHELALMMSQHKINRIPIVDSERKLIGIVTRADLIKSLAKQNRP